MMCAYGVPQDEDKFREALNMAIEALKQEPCEDAISRKAVLDVLQNCYRVAESFVSLATLFEDNIKALPSVTPQPKMEWILVSEQLPQDGELVLFSTKTDRVFEGRFFADNTEHQWYAFRDEAFAWNNVVNAWMPLPEPYKAESEANKGFGNGKATLDNGYGLFLNMLEYKLADRGKYFIKVDKWYPSSQLCSCCGKQKKLTLADRIYKCDCGLTINRDYNAAINIKNEGLRILKSA